MVGAHVYCLMEVRHYIKNYMDFYVHVFLICRKAAGLTADYMVQQDARSTPYMQIRETVSRYLPFYYVNGSIFSGNLETV